YLGNFSPEDARSVIQSLTESSQFYLEPPLIDELVRDLARDLNEIRPIELQVVGAQLQTDKITTLAQYQEQGPKEKLVGRFLEEVVKDCGNNNEQFAKLVLYLLTDENNTRPLKTRAELEADLALEPTRLDLILKILVKSGLVFQVPGFPADRYQLVHDYLVPFVREQQSARLIAELEKEKEQRKLTEARLNQVLTQQLKTSRRATATLSGLILVISGITIAAIVFGINTYIISLSNYSEEDTGLEPLISSLKAGKKLKQLSMGVIPENQLRVISDLSKAIQNITEINRIEEGHEKSITALSFSSDNKMLATASEDNTAKIWSIPDGKLLTTLQGHIGSVTSVNFSPNGKMLATASEDNTAKIWSIPDGKLLTTLKGHKKGVTFVKFSPKGELLATTSKDKTVKIWNQYGTYITTLPVLSDQDVIVSFSPDNQTIATGGNYDTVKLWNLKGKQLASIDEYGTFNINFTNNGQAINLFNKDGTLSLWSTQDTQIPIISKENCGTQGELLSVSPDQKSWLIKDPSQDKYFTQYIVDDRVDEKYCYPIKRFKHNDSITYVTFSPDSKLLASVSKDRVVKIQYINDKAPSFTTKNGDNPSTVKFSFNGQIVALGSEDNEIKLQNRDGTLIKIIKGNSSILSFSPDNQMFATRSPENVLKLSKLNRNQEITLKGNNNSITSIKSSPDSQLIAAVSADNSISLWHSNGAFIKTLPRNAKEVTNISFSPDSQIFATISRDNSVRLYKRDATLINTLPGHTVKVTSISFSLNSQRFATIGDDNLVKLYKRDGTLIQILTGHSTKVTNIEFSPDSSKLISVSSESGEIKLWSSNDGKLLKSIDSYDIESATFSPNGNIITSINVRNTVKLWSLEGNLLTTLKGHSAEITKVSFSPDGTKIATSSADSTVRLWDLKGNKLKIWREHTKGVNDVSFSPNNKFIASASTDNTVKVWRSSDDKSIKTLQGFSDGVNDDIHITEVSFSSDSKIISAVSTISDRSYISMWLWNSDSKPIKSFRNDLNILDRTTFNPNNQTVAFVSKDESLKLWSIKGKLLATMPGHTDLINSITFSPNSKIIASGSDDKTVRLWNKNGIFLKTIPAHEDKVNSVTFSPDGKIIASASKDKTVKLWNLDGTLQKTINDSDEVTNVRFSPDGKVLAYMSSKDIKFWSFDGKKIESLKDDYSNTGSLSFSKDSKKLAFGDQDNANLYLLDSIWQKKSFLYSISSFSGERFSPSGKTIAVDSNEGKIYLNLDLDDLLKRACSWASDYLKNNPNMKNDRHLCDDINPQK
ncbi:PD40 domain-containing protein, partial [Nostoc sp. UCD122]|nr:PD40 domain-containing protein [Nostoc sp. UCD122]